MPRHRTSARKVRTTKTAEQRHDEAAELHMKITEQVEALRDSEAWTRFLEFAAAFHRYSLGNVLLIQAQYPLATRVAGYRTWQALGRQVRTPSRIRPSFFTSTWANSSGCSRW